MKRWPLIAFGVACYVLLLLASAPASLVDGVVRDASHGRLRLAQAQGSVWSGRGQLELRDSHGASALVRPLHWRLRAAPLLLARLAFDVGVDDGSPPFPLTLSFSDITLADARFSVPASALGAVLPKLDAFGVSGQVDVRIARLTLAEASTQGDITVHWRQAASALTPVAPLGDYEFHLDGQAAELRASLRTLQGPLQLDGHGAWPQGGRPQFQAVAQMPAAAREQLAPFLRLVAVERGDGSFEWRLQ